MVFRGRWAMILRRFILPLANRYGIGFIFYCGIAIVSALSEWLSFSLALLKVGPNAAAILAFFVATLVNLLLSRRTFRSMRGLWSEVVLVMVMSGIAFVFNFSCFVALYYYASINVLAAKISGTFVGFGFNYVARQFFIFSPIPVHSPLSVVARRLRPRSNRGKFAAAAKVDDGPELI
jgi:putative flippase GtrA